MPAELASAWVATMAAARGADVAVIDSVAQALESLQVFLREAIALGN